MMKIKTWRWVLGLIYILAVATIWIAASYKWRNLLFWRRGDDTVLPVNRESEVVNLLVEKHVGVQADGLDVGTNESVNNDDVALESNVVLDQHADEELDSEGRWTRTRLAKVSLLICPFWFLAQLSFNFSLKYTTVTIWELFAMIKQWMDCKSQESSYENCCRNRSKTWP